MIQEQNNPLMLNDITSKPSLTSISVMLDAEFGTGKSHRTKRGANKCLPALYPEGIVSNMPAEKSSAQDRLKEPSESECH